MSTSQFPDVTGKMKKGNGMEFLMHQEQEVQKNHLDTMRPFMNTRNNLYYTKMRDDIEKQYKKLHDNKQKEMENQNQKMHSKLISILNNEKRSLSKHRNSLGPNSLNVVVRRQEINRINLDNEIMSKKLNDAKTTIPTKDELVKHIRKVDGFKRAVSTRKDHGAYHVDPLVRKRQQFLIATADNYDMSSTYLPNSNVFLQSDQMYSKRSFQTNLSPQGTMEDLQASKRVISAKKSLPFNTNMISKHT